MLSWWRSLLYIYNKQCKMKKYLEKKNTSARLTNKKIARCGIWKLLHVKQILVCLFVCSKYYFKSHDLNVEKIWRGRSLKKEEDEYEKKILMEKNIIRHFFAITTSISLIRKIIKRKKMDMKKLQHEEYLLPGNFYAIKTSISSFCEPWFKR